MSASKEQIARGETDLSAMLTVGERLVAFEISREISYGDGGGFTVEAVAKDWVVVRDANGRPHFQSVAAWMPEYRHQISTIVEKWVNGPL